MPLDDMSPEQPSGPNLEFDPDFIELERLAQGKPEQQYGSHIVAAEEPDWKAVVAAAEALLARSHDMRVMAQLAVARLQLRGLPAYVETLSTIREALEARWESVHPQLDPDDDNDPTLRSNGLLRLAEPGPVLRAIREMPLARSARAGSVSWRDIAVSTGLVEADADTPKLNEATLHAAFAETNPDALRGLRAAVQLGVEHAAAIPAAFDRQAGYGTGPELGELAKLLREIGRAMDKYTPVAGEAPAAEDAPEPDAAPDAPVAAPAPRAAVASIASLGPVTNRADALRLLDLVVRYYEHNEPSSPVPLLIGRAMRLADKGFIDLLRDLAPDGINQMETIAGRREE